MENAAKSLIKSTGEKNLSSGHGTAVIPRSSQEQWLSKLRSAQDLGPECCIMDGEGNTHKAP